MMDRKILRLDGEFKPLTKADLHIDEVLTSSYAYSEGLVKIIDREGFIHTATDMGHAYRCMYADHLCIKIEGMEKLSQQLHDFCRVVAAKFHHTGPVTCHAFIAWERSTSFPMHTDPDDVMLYVVEGQKTMEFDEFPPEQLGPGAILYMPYNTRHRANNEHASVMLSFGIERFIMEKLSDDAHYLRQDDGIVSA